MSQLNFGTGQETKSENLLAFCPTWQNQFNVAKLTKVEAVLDYTKKDGTKTDYLRFEFRSPDGKRGYDHTEWKPELSKQQEQLENIKTRIAHIHKAFKELPVNPIGSTAKDFGEYFKAIEEAFNKGLEGKEIFADKLVWIKLVYGISGKGKVYPNLGFPLSPNFIEPFVKDQMPKTIAINKTYETLDQPSGTETRKIASATDVPSGIPQASGLPDF